MPQPWPDSKCEECFNTSSEEPDGPFMLECALCGQAGCEECITNTGTALLCEACLDEQRTKEEDP